MITIQSGKMIIPENERFVGFAGDNLTRTKEFLVPDAADSDSAYTLYLRFDDDRVSSAVLEKSTDGGDLILTWTVLSEHLLRSGIALAQIRITDGEDAVSHTGWDYFVIAPGAELDGDGAELAYVTRSEFERRIDETGLDVDSAISSTSTNPVQNKVVKAYVDGVALSFPTALSALENDVGYIPVYSAGSVPPTSQTATFYPAPCLWMYDERFWLVYNRSQITIPGSPSQYIYYYFELAESGNMMQLANTATAVPSNSGHTAPDYASEEFGGLKVGQMFRCVLGSGLDTVMTYWIKTGSSAAWRLAEYGNIPDISTKADKATTLSGYGITDAYTKTQVDGMIPVVPTNVSSFTNDAGYLTAHQSISGKMDKTYAANDMTAINAVPTGQLFTGQGRLAHKTAIGFDEIAYLTDIPTVPTAVSDLSNDAGYLPLIQGASIPPATTTTYYPTPCVWVYDDRFWVMFGALLPSPPNPAGTHCYTSYEITNMRFADSGTAVPQNSAGTAPDTSSGEFDDLRVGQMFRCVLGSGLDTTVTYWIKTGSSAAWRIAYHGDISGKEDYSNKVTSLSSSSTDTQYPSAKCVYDLVGNVETLLASLL